MTPTYDSSKTPVKNMQALLRFLNVSPIENTIENLTAQVIGKVAELIGPPQQTPANITTAGAGTYSAANIAGGIITRDPNGGNRTDTTDTAANLISALNLSANYKVAYCTIVNTADAAETITLAGGTGVTLKGTITCEQNCVIRIAITRTSSTTVSVRAV